MLLEKRVKNNKTYFGYTRRLPYCKPEEVIPYKFVSYNNFLLPGVRDGLYILKDERGVCSIYDKSSGICYLNLDTEFTDVEVLSYRASRNSFYYKATNKKGQVGIVHCSLKDEQVISNIAYPFGDADEITEVESDIVSLVKYDGNIKHIGYFTHPDFGRVRPLYRSFDSIKLNVSMPSVPSYCLVEAIKYHGSSTHGTPIHSISNRISLIEYTAEINNSVLKGIKQLVYSQETSTVFENRFKWENLFKPQYADIKLDTENQIAILKKKQDGKTTLGIAFLARNWNIRKTGTNLIGGDIAYLISAMLPCQYSDIKIIKKRNVTKKLNDSVCECLLQVKEEKTNKVGLVLVKYAKVVGDYDYVGRVRENVSSVEEVVPCSYDRIERHDDTFVGYIRDNAVLITDVVDQNGQFVTSSRYERYKNFTKVKDNGYVALCFNGTKQFLTVLQKEGLGARLASTKQYKDIKVLDDVIVGVNFGSLSSDIIYQTSTSLKRVYENVLDVTGVASYPKRVYKIKLAEDKFEPPKTIFVNATGQELKLLHTFNGKDIEVDYYPTINAYRIKKNNIFTLVSGNMVNDPIFNKEFSVLDIKTCYDEAKIPTSYITYKKHGFNYAEEYVLLRKTVFDSKVLRVGNFKPEDIYALPEEHKIIIKEVDSITKKSKYGVIDGYDGHEVIPFKYEKISYNKFSNKFLDDNGCEIEYKEDKKVKRL